MNLLGAKLYDPAGAVSKVTTSLIAQTAFDTTNLRIAFTVPAHGLVRVKMACVHHGSTTIAQVLLGILEGSTVRARVAPNVNLLQTAVATSQVLLWCDFTVAGLSPGAVNWDASYGVEIIASANGAIKYGGPNNTTTNDAFGAFVFEIWDPQPLKTGLDGGVNVTQFGGSAGTFSGGRPEVNTSHIAGSAVSTTTAQIGVNVVQISTDATAADNAEAFFDGTGYAGTNNVMPTTTTVTNMVTANVTQLSGDSTAADNAEAFFDGTGYAGTNNVIPTVTSVTNRVTANTDQIEGVDATNQIRDSILTDATRFAGANIDAAITSRLAPTTAGRTLDVTATGGAGVDWGNVENQSTAVNLSGTTINLVNTVTTYTGNTVQTGDSFARLGAPAGASVSADIAAVKSQTAAIETDTAEIGVAGAGLTNINLPDQTMNITGDITGNLSGSVGSVTGLNAANLDATISSRATQASVDTIDGIVDAILDDTGTSGVVVAAASKTGYRLSATGVDDILDEVVEGTVTLRAVLRGYNAALLSKASGLATTTAVFRDIDDTKDRITATVDSNGNRTAITLDLT